MFYLNVIFISNKIPGHPNPPKGPSSPEPFDVQPPDLLKPAANRCKIHLDNNFPSTGSCFDTSI